MEKRCIAASLAYARDPNRSPRWRPLDRLSGGGGSHSPPRHSSLCLGDLCETSSIWFLNGVHLYGCLLRRGLRSIIYPRIWKYTATFVPTAQGWVLSIASRRALNS